MDKITTQKNKKKAAIRRCYLGTIRDAATAKAILAVIRERQRQMDAEGWTFDHDASANNQGDLLMAALCYIDPDRQLSTDPQAMPREWPWSRDWWKPCFGDRRYPDDAAAIRRETEKGAALLVAEVDRIAGTPRPYPWIAAEVSCLQGLSAKHLAPAATNETAWQERVRTLIHEARAASDKAPIVRKAAASAIIALAAMTRN